MSIIDGKGITAAPRMKYVQFISAIELTVFSDLRERGLSTEGWYFWDETNAFAYGPFKTESIAEEALDRYIREELSGGVE